MFGAAGLIAVLFFFTVPAIISAQGNYAEDCIILNPIANTIVAAGEKMKISWINSHIDNFDSIYLIQLDGDARPVVIAQNVSTEPGEIIVDLPHSLIPSNAYYMTLGSPPLHCSAGNLRIVGSKSRIPDQKVPSTFENQITTGRFPKTEIEVLNDSAAQKSFVLKLCTVILTVSVAISFHLLKQ